MANSSFGELVVERGIIMSDAGLTISIALIVLPIFIGFLLVNCPTGCVDFDLLEKTFQYFSVIVGVGVIGTVISLYFKFQVSLPFL